MNSTPLQERPPVDEDSSEFFESIKLDQPPKYVPRYLKAVATQDSLPLGSDDIITHEELELELELLDLEDCKANHHTTLHGSTHPKVMAIKTRSMSGPDQNNLVDTGRL